MKITNSLYLILLGLVFISSCQVQGDRVSKTLGNQEICYISVSFCYLYNLIKFHSVINRVMLEHLLAQFKNQFLETFNKHGMILYSICALILRKS